MTNSRRWRRALAFAALLVALVLPLSACGKKSQPVAPTDEPNVYPRTYPHE